MWQKIKHYLILWSVIFVLFVAGITLLDIFGILGY